MRKLFLMISALFLMHAGMQAKVRLPHVLGDNMVIQQDADVRLWGSAKPNSTVKVSVSWSGDAYSAKADRKGEWQLTVKTPKADNKPLTVRLDDGDGEVALSNLLAGEVWVCAGQSNMEMPMKGFKNQPVENAVEDILHSSDSNLRLFTVKRNSQFSAVDTVSGSWKEACPASVREFSATAYYFGRELRRMLNVPVGLIMANKGGSKVESWLTKENLKKYTDEPVDSQAIVKKYPADYHRALMWGNGTFSPILKYTVKGILFYQGCSNVGDPGNQYSDRLALLVKQWRDAFGCGEIPFYFVQIAPYDYGNVDADWGAKLREQQVRARDIIPNSGLVCTNDCVYPWEARQIHPAQKQKVGERLAFLALNKTYGQETILCESPEFKELKIEGDTCCIRLKNDYGGVSRLDDMQGFEVAGADKVFHPAKASYDNAKGIVVTCPEVKAPVAVRYCFKNFQLGNVANMGGLPLLPFRTDNW